MLTLKAPITTKADNNFDFFFFLKKIGLDISSESSAWQTIHMKYQDLFSLKNKKIKILECPLLQIWLGALRVNNSILLFVDVSIYYWMSGKQCWSWSNAAFWGILSESTLFAQTRLSQGLQ